MNTHSGPSASSGFFFATSQAEILIIMRYSWGKNNEGVISENQISTGKSRRSKVDTDIGRITDRVLYFPKPGHL